MFSEDADWQAMNSKLFLAGTVTAHLAKQDLRALIKAGQHWVFCFAPECLATMLHFGQLYEERLGAEPDVIPVSLPAAPLGQAAFLVFPRQHLSADEIASVMEFPGTALEDLALKPYIAVSTPMSEYLNAAVVGWLYIDNLLN